MKQLTVVLLFLSVTIIFAQSDPYADSVVYFQKGIGDYANQNPPYFPDNVLGEPSRTATDTIPETSPYEICSLGLGGEIILKFTNNAIVDGQGVDFTVFENAFIILYGARAGEIFAEPAKVAVSKDGINFYEFPFDSLTLVGLAGKTPTHGYADPTNPDSSGGDSFDLSVVGLDTAYYVKLTDVTEIIMDTSHPYFDPTANGFDLDAVVAVHSSTVTGVNSDVGNDRISFTLSNPYPNPLSLSSKASLSLKIKAKGEVRFTIYNILGEKIYSEKYFAIGSFEQVSLPLNFSSSGVYFIMAENKGKVQRRKIVIVK